MEIKQNVELLNKLGYEYDELRKCFYSPENDSYVSITLDDCKDVLQMVTRLIYYERKISFSKGEAHAKRVIRNALGLKI